MTTTKGNAFARIRKKCGFTQQRLADECGVSVKTIQLWELKGTKSANVATLSKAANTMNVDLSEILC